jgi:MoaA/NifB/PqqE/SkfB family radical SAM enzyme
MFKVENRWPHYYDSCKIEWNIGRRCNLDCTYCPAEIHDNVSPHTDITVLQNAVEIISKIPNVRVSLTGGEPCVHPKIESLLEYMRPQIKWINVTTNATRKAKFYESLPVDHIVFSLHFEDSKWKERLFTILEFAEFNNDKIPYTVHVMAHHIYMEHVIDAVLNLEHRNVPFVIRRIRWSEKHDWFNDMKYDFKDLDWILSFKSTASPNTLIDGKELAHTNDLIKEHKNKFKGWSCRAGVESLMINWDGEVHRATCRVGGSLGNIYTGTFAKPTEPIICTREWCTCAADVNITKTLIDI